MTDDTSPQPPDALLFVASSCPHCPTVLHALAELVKSGRIRELRIFNIAHAGEEAAQHGIRSVPWIRIGPFELTGLHGERELAEWVDRAATFHGHEEYLVELITHSQLVEAADVIRRHPEHGHALVELLGNPATELSIRIGAGALVEELAESGDLHTLIPALSKLVHHMDARIRGDAAHYLGLSGARTVIPALQGLLTDPDAEVREIAADSLAAIMNNALP